MEEDIAAARSAGDTYDQDESVSLVTWWEHVAGSATLEPGIRPAVRASRPSAPPRASGRNSCP